MSLNSNSRPPKRSGTDSVLVRVKTVCAQLYSPARRVYFVVVAVLTIAAFVVASFGATQKANSYSNTLDILRESISVELTSDIARRQQLYANVVLVFGTSDPTQSRMYALQEDLLEGYPDGITEEAYTAASGVLLECAERRVEAGGRIRNAEVFVAALKVAAKFVPESGFAPAEQVAAFRTLVKMAPPLVEPVEETASIISSDACARDMFYEIPF